MTTFLSDFKSEFVIVLDFIVDLYKIRCIVYNTVDILVMKVKSSTSNEKTVVL